MSVTIKVGATQTGGTDTVLTSSGGVSPGKVTMLLPSGTRLTPKTVDFLTTNPTVVGTNPGTARGGVRVVMANRVTEEGCCTTQVGSVIIDLTVRWPLTQPSTLVDEAIAVLRGLVYAPEFVDSIKKGTLPG